MRFLKSLGLAVTAAAGLALAALPAQAEWPDGPITMLIGYKAGGGTDTKGRVLAKLLGEELGVPVKVVNKPGGGQATSLLWFKGQEPDGKVFFFGAVTGLTMMPNLKPSLEYRWGDFDYCCGVTEFQPAMVAPASAPFDDWAGMIAHAKKQGNLKYVSLSPLAKMIMQVIAEKEGLNVDYIPTKGGAGMVQLILSNQVEFGYSGGIHSRYPGKFKTLAVTTSKRQAHYPDTPTLLELGYPVPNDAPTVIAFPKGTDPAIIAKMEAAVEAAVQKQPMKDISEKISMPINFVPTSDITPFVENSYNAMAKMVKDTGYQPN